MDSYNYEFTGWDDDPMELFDQGSWPEVMHVTIQALNYLGLPNITEEALKDTGLLHELSHLACGIEINTHTAMQELRYAFHCLLFLVHVRLAEEYPRGPE